MNVLHLSTDDYSGGSAIATFRLHSAMRHLGINSNMLVIRKTRITDNNIHQINSTIVRKIEIRLLEKLNYKKINYLQSRGLFSYPKYGNDLSSYRNVTQADVIYLHWINRDFLTISDLENIFKLKKPIFWVLHDMWPMTGGCHHSFECDKYVSHCSNCPHLVNPSRNDLSNKLFHSKLKIFEKYTNLHIVTPSVWLGECAKKSKLFSTKSISVIPNILDTEVFKPMDKKTARRLFNLPEEKNIILFGAIEGHLNPYKGWSYLQEALQESSLLELNLAALIFGSEYNNEIEKAIPFPVYFSGQLKDNESICMLYNAADIFVAPSIADNFPNTISESLSCGTPVVGFNVGGIPDLVQHKINGYLAKYKDSKDLAVGISWALNNKESLQKNSRIWIEQMMNKAITSIKNILNFG